MLEHHFVVCSWYFGPVDRHEAEKLLMHTTNATGSFLVRENTSTHGNYSVSVRDTKKVRHHKIQKLDSGGYFLTPQVTFASIPELVTYYSKQSNGLLKNPCIIEEPKSTGSSSKLEAEE